MRLKLPNFAALAADWLPDTLMVTGTGAVSYGAALIYAPAGFIVGGLLLLAGGVLAARRGR